MKLPISALRLVVIATLALGASAAGCVEPPVGPLRAAEGEEGDDGERGAGEAGVAADAGDAEAGAAAVSFRRDIRPLMSRDDAQPHGCRRCHYRGGGDPQGLELGGLDLTTLGDLRRGGVSSKRRIVVPGDPGGSALVQKLQGSYPRGSRMPKGRPPWSAEEVALVRRWIAEGARGADDE